MCTFRIDAVAVVLALAMGAGLARAEEPAVQASGQVAGQGPGASGSTFAPAALSLLPEDQSVYAPPVPAREDEGLNLGGVNFDINFRYLTDYVYRGVDHSEVGGAEDAPNLQFDTRLSFNLGKFPHPFIGAFVNVYNSDPISRFQEIRPYFGFTWNLRPFEFEAGNITYIFPERDNLNTGEVYVKLTFDDSWLFQTNRNLLAPYVLVAYDYDKYNGCYFEAGLRHDMVFEGTGLTVSFVGHIAYVLNNPFFITKVGGSDTGLQHYEVGVIASYSLNHLFKVANRYGNWSVEGYLYYDDKTSTDLRADTQVWGGMGIGFKY